MDGVTYGVVEWIRDPSCMVAMIRMGMVGGNDTFIRVFPQTPKPRHDIDGQLLLAPNSSIILADRNGVDLARFDWPPVD